jgi:hypothetical protein
MGDNWKARAIIAAFLLAGFWRFTPPIAWLRQNHFPRGYPGVVAVRHCLLLVLLQAV